MTRTGPDGVQTFTQYDTANRVSFMRRGPSDNPLMTASYTYHANGNVHQVTYGNGATVTYTYDAGNRVYGVDHHSGSAYLNLAYFYANHPDLPSAIYEFDSGGAQRATNYEYDTRNRLKREWRWVWNGGPVNLYDLNYTYDDNGNRLTKEDTALHRKTIYTYDLSDPVLYGSENNRLMKGEEYNTQPNPDVLLSTTWYLYNCSGNVERVVKNTAGTNDYTANRLVYGMNNRTVTFIADESYVSSGGPVSNYQITAMREYRYDSGRARYLARSFNPERVMAYMSNPSFWSVKDAEHPEWEVVERFTDYDGDEPYGEFIKPQYDFPYESIVNTYSYEPGVWRKDHLAGGGAGVSEYLHNDQLGTLRQTSGTSGSLGTLRVFTAFGERTAGPATADRYGYVGAHGYQAANDLPFLHVGARYYDPGSGRFLQRDPIGIEGDFNVYMYASQSPVELIDPTGFSTNNPGGAAGNTPAGMREVAETVNGMKNARQLAARAAREAAKRANKAKEILKNKKNKDFKRGLHKNLKPKTKVPQKNKSNPDMFWEDVYDAWEEWNALGCPVPK